MLEFLYPLFTAIFYPLLIKLSPLYFILFISFLVSIISTLIYIHTTNQSEMRYIKKEIDKLIKDLKRYKDNPLVVSQIQKEISNKNMQVLSYTIVPNLITIMPLFIFFGWLRFVFQNITPIELSPIFIFGWRPGWFAIYFISAILWSILLRKLIKVY